MPPESEAPPWYEASVVDFIMQRYLIALGGRKVRVSIEPSYELLAGPLKALAWASPGSVETYGSATAVGADVAGDVLVLTVDDKGPGISPDQRERVLQPFVRLEGSRNRNTGGPAWDWRSHRRWRRATAAP